MKHPTTYSVGDVVLVRGRITRKVEEVNNKPMYRLNMLGIGIDIDTNEGGIAGTTTDIPNDEE
jgi:hypothetical protein